MTSKVAATPHPYPRGGELSPDNTVIFVIDMQIDFCGEDGYVHRAGIDLALLRAPIGPIGEVLSAARAEGYRIAHTRAGYSADLSDLQGWREWLNPNDPVRIGDAGPLGRALVRGEPCWDFIPELTPEPGERVFDKAGFGLFAFTDAGAVLEGWGVRNLVLTGVTTDCCVHSVLREAVDRGYDCLTLEDCVGATQRSYHEAALTVVKKTSGIFGTVSDSATFIRALGASGSRVERQVLSA